jgi:hypothetical protein
MREPQARHLLCSIDRTRDDHWHPLTSVPHLPFPEGASRPILAAPQRSSRCLTGAGWPTALPSSFCGPPTLWPHHLAARFFCSSHTGSVFVRMSLSQAADYAVPAARKTIILRGAVPRRTKPKRLAGAPLSSSDSPQDSLVTHNCDPRVAPVRVFAFELKN